MALDAADWTVSIGGDIRWTGAGTASNVSVLEIHRWLSDLADDAVASGDDLLDITDETPSDRATDNIISLINGYNIDDTAAEHIFDGSISQDNGDTFYRGLVVVGAVESGTQIQVVQNNSLLTSYWGAGLNADAGANILLRIMVKTRADGADIDNERIRVFARELGDSYAEFSVTMGAGNNTAALFTGADLNNPTASGTISTYDQFNNTEGYQQLDINGDGTNEDYYSQWTVTGGGSTPASPGINDLYEWAKYVQRRGTAETIHGMNGDLFRGITHQWDYDTEGGAQPATNDVYVWGLLVSYDNEGSGPFVVGEGVTIGGATTVGRIIALDDNGATGSMVVDIELDGTPADNDAIVGLTSGATADVAGAPVGQSTGGGSASILAVDDNGVAGTVWVQILKGTAPADNAICYELLDHTQVLTVDGSPTSRTLPSTFLGASTGSSVIGAFGIGIDPTDLTQNDQLFDLTNTLRVPPNNVTFTVSGLVSGEDYVLVGPESGGSLDTNQLTLDAALTTDNISAVVMNATLPADTPTTGTIRVFDDNGIARKLSYNGLSTTNVTDDTFDITTTDGNEDFGTVNASISNDVFISYIDELAVGSSADFTTVFLSPRALFARVRDGGTAGDLEGIKTFETPATLSSSGGSATAIRTSDA